MDKNKLMFYIAALWNFSAAVVALSSPQDHIRIFYGAEYVTDDFIAQVFLTTFWVIVAMFGVGYCLIAKDPKANRGVVVLGIMGKLYVFVLWSCLFFLGKAKVMALVGGCGDLVFALLFWRYLYKNRPNES